jgi:AraC-like DNA-binding protein
MRLFYTLLQNALANFAGNAMNGAEKSNDALQKNAFFERIIIPEGQSFLWRLDDYPWRRCVWNYHPEFEIHLIRHSSGLFYVGDHIGHFSAGHLVLVGNDLPHNWVTPDIGESRLAARDIVVQFDPKRLLDVAQMLPEMAKLETLFEHAAFGIEFTAQTAKAGAELLEKMGTVRGLAQLAILIELLALMADANDQNTLATPQYLSQFRPGTPTELLVLDRALEYIQRHYLEGPSLAVVSSIVGMSESAFSRFFKAHTGNTFSDHVITLRLWTARKLLTETKIPITNICYEAGFSNISNFNRTFLERVGMTPSQYRKASLTRSLPDAPDPESLGYCRLGISVEQSRFVRRRNIWHKFVLRLAKCLSQLLVDVMRWVCGVASAYARLFFVEAVTLFDDGICLVEADVGRVTVLRLS